MAETYQQVAEYDAVINTYSEWDDGDLAATNAQQLSMSAQKSYSSSHEASTSSDHWSGLSDEQRNILKALEANKISREDAARALGTIASRSCQ